MSNNPCHHPCDWTDGDQPDVTDLGCCSPAPIRKNCEAPTVPTPECDEEDPTVIYDPETETFNVLSILYDSTCSALTDSNGSTLTGLIS